MKTKTEKIAELNDLCRTTMGFGGRMVQSIGVNSLPSETQSAIREKVELFNNFNEGNNPHGERDFGSIEHEGHKIFWKIDYYDKQLRFHSDDPSDMKKTRRVLTIMLAEEY